MGRHGDSATETEEHAGNKQTAKPCAPFKRQHGISNDQAADCDHQQFVDPVRQVAHGGVNDTTDKDPQHDQNTDGRTRQSKG